jgi:hypothetical protein
VLEALHLPKMSQFQPEMNQWLLGQGLHETAQFVIQLSHVGYKEQHHKAM